MMKDQDIDNVSRNISTLKTVKDSVVLKRSITVDRVPEVTRNYSPSVLKEPITIDSKDRNCMSDYIIGRK